MRRGKSGGGNREPASEQLGPGECLRQLSKTAGGFAIRVYPFFLVLWFLIQLVSATGAAAEGAGVAFWAHVGGFVAGVGATWLLCRLRWIDPCSQGLQHAPAWNRRRMTWN